MGDVNFTAHEKMKYLLIEDKSNLISLLEILEVNKSDNKMVESYRLSLIKIISDMIVNNYKN